MMQWWQKGICSLQEAAGPALFQHAEIELQTTDTCGIVYCIRNMSLSGTARDVWQRVEKRVIDILSTYDPHNDVEPAYLDDEDIVKWELLRDDRAVSET